MGPAPGVKPPAQPPESVAAAPSTSTSPNPTDRLWWPAAENRKGSRGASGARKPLCVTAVGPTRLHSYPKSPDRGLETGGPRWMTWFLPKQRREKKRKSSRRRPSAAFPASLRRPSCPSGRAFPTTLARPGGERSTHHWPGAGPELPPSLTSAPCTSSPGDALCQDLCQVLTGASSWEPGNNPGEA